mgnify:CR=1 FL=1
MSKSKSATWSYYSWSGSWKQWGLTNFELELRSIFVTESWPISCKMGCTIFVQHITVDLGEIRGGLDF